jgi:hypothetical protein
MVVTASVSGVLKTILMLLGAMVVLKYLGQLLVAKRNIAEQSRFREEQDKIQKQKAHFERNKGKISILRNVRPQNVKDVDYEEVN